MAQAAGVKTLVLSHLVPGRHHEQMWIDAASRHFGERIIVGWDLMEL